MSAGNSNCLLWNRKFSPLLIPNLPELTVRDSSGNLQDFLQGRISRAQVGQ